MSLGDAWDETTPGSVSKLNKVTVISGTGTYIASLDKDEHSLFRVLDSTGGLTANHLYMCSADGLTLIDVTSLVNHQHSGSGDGGSLIDVYTGNSIAIDLLLTRTNDLKKAQWIETVSGTGTIEDDTDGTTGERSIRLRPNGTSGSGATIAYPHLTLDYGLSSNFVTKLLIETASSIALHTGIGCDTITAADSNTRKVQAEVCTTTNNNWWLRTATGSANSASDSGVAITANRTGLSMYTNPAGTPHTDLAINNSVVLQKTTNIPTSGGSADNNLIKHSVKNNTGADRPLKIYGSRISYITFDNWS